MCFSDDEDNFLDFELFNKNTNDFENITDTNINREFLQENNNTAAKHIREYYLNTSLCDSCGIETREDNATGVTICPKCGLEVQKIEDQNPNFDTNNQHNTSKTSSITTKIEGKNSHAYNRTLRGTCSNYKLWNRKREFKKLYKCSFESKNNKVPPYVIERSLEYYEKIRPYKTFRGTGKISIIASLVYYICQQEGIAIKPKEIANVFNLHERDLSKGDSTVRKYVELKVLDIRINKDNHDNYTEKYIQLLGMDMGWKKIILDIINKAERRHMYTSKTPKPSTKVIGCIYLLIQSSDDLKSKITKDEIEKKCNISTTTFIDNYKLLLSGKKKIMSIYRKYNLTFPD
jgi:transcription initiation factor TFIIIB Brf1 subunit/transcription initiation factor TFIIB